MADQPPTYGIDAGNQEMVSGSRWPYIRPKDGDRVRFHFLTTGSDPWLVATKFHRIGEGMAARNILCVGAITRGEEQCSLCDMDSTQGRRGMFGMWLLVDYILHPHDNPDEEGDSWEQKKLKIKLDDGTEKQRSVFMEQLTTKLGDDVVVPGQVKLLQLPAGRQQIWWSQFSNAWVQSQNLRKHLYELHRTGSGRDDTKYTLNTIKEDPLDEDLLEREDIKDLPTIEEVFRGSLSQMPSGDAVLGKDQLDGETQETSSELPKAEPANVGTDDLV